MIQKVEYSNKTYQLKTDLLRMHVRGSLAIGHVIVIVIMKYLICLNYRLKY